MPFVSELLWLLTTSVINFNYRRCESSQKAQTLTHKGVLKSITRVRSIQKRVLILIIEATDSILNSRVFVQGNSRAIDFSVMSWILVYIGEFHGLVSGNLLYVIMCYESDLSIYTHACTCIHVFSDTYRYIHFLTHHKIAIPHLLPISKPSSTYNALI